MLSSAARSAETASLSMAPPEARPRDLLAEASEDHFWIARVVRDPADNSTRTEIILRSNWSIDWTEIDPVNDRVVSMATSNGELLMVLGNGQWEIADDQGTRAGPAGSDWNEMLAVASDSNTVWAVVRWSPPSTEQSETSATLPATAPATEPAAPSHEPMQGETESHLMVCQFSDGQWLAPLRLPSGVADDPAQMSLADVNGMPVLAWRTAEGRLCVSHLTDRHTWSKPVFVDVPTGPFDFKLMSVRDRSLLWIAPAEATTRPTTQTSAGSVGEVLIGDDFTRRIPLRLSTAMPSNVGPQTLVAAFGNLRWIAYSGNQQIEQDFSLDAFPQSFPPAPKMSAVPSAKAPAVPLDPWIAGDALLVMVAALTALRQKKQPEPEAKPDRKQEKPGLAPLGVRFVAGLVDLAPIFAVLALVQAPAEVNPLAAIGKSLPCLAVATYVLHTMVAELICGQSIGKMVFGLRVLDTEGRPAGAGAIVLRNLLRVVDLLIAPALIVFITPLHQRVGDIIAGTVVITREGEDEDEGAQGS